MNPQHQHLDSVEPRTKDATVTSLPPLIPLPTAAKMLGLSRASAYRYAASDELPVRRFGRRVYALRSGLARLLDVEENQLPNVNGEAAA